MTPHSEVRPDWGHPLKTPEGIEIRVPSWAFTSLRRLGLLVENKAQLSPMIYQMLEPQFDCLMDGLSRMLGRDCSGPEWCLCGCDQCKAKLTIQKRHVPHNQVNR